MKKHCCKKRGSDTYQKSNYATFYIKTWQNFCILTAGFTKSCHSKRSLKAVNNTPAPQIWRFVTCQNCQMICKPYCWDKQHANMSPHDRLINSYALLPENNVSFFFFFFFLSVFNAHTSILSSRNHFCMIFLNSHKYFQDIFLRHVRDVTEETSFFEICLSKNNREPSWMSHKVSFCIFL